MDLAQIVRNIKNITQTLEKISKRLRRVEVLSRLAEVEQVDTFLDLADTPDSYAGMYGWVPTINNLETGLEFLPVGGGACVAFTCGAVGWRAVGGTDPRTLVHEEAFQLDTGGDARGVAAIDLQYTRSNANEVAGGNYSAILNGEENRITDSGGQSLFSTINGSNNYIDDAYDCHIRGSYNEIYDESFAIFLTGQSNELLGCDWGSYLGSYFYMEEAFGSFSLGEANVMIPNVNESTYYNGSFGIQQYHVGDVWLTYLFGEQNEANGLGAAAPDLVMWSSIIGFDSYLGNVKTNFAFGQGVRSYRPTGDGFYDGRFVFSGDWPNKSPAVTPPEDGFSTSSGFNQDSWFSQSDLITDWAAAAAWTTSRFEFPIITDSIWGFLAYIVGTEQGCANSYLWKIEGVAENDGDTTTILASTVTNVYRDVATKEWQVIADDPNDRFVFQYRDTAGADATDCNIQLSMLTMEVGFAA